MDPLLLSSATELAARIRSGELSSRHVVDVHIARIEHTQRRINAVVRDRFAEARREADLADARARTGGTLPRLLGVPCTIKESFELGGMPNTAGLVARKSRDVAGSDAVAVARLRAAGAIPLGVTNTSELCMWMESANRVYGRTNNPYDETRIAGGSSGGEGAIVGAAGSPFGLGADIGGSIRGPAFFNGVFGHKPSVGLVPNEGQFPLAENDANRMLATGPLARRAEDLLPLVEILAGRALPDPREVTLGELTVLDVRGNGIRRVSDELLAAQQRAARHLAGRGACVREARFAGLKRSFDLWSSMMTTAADTSYSQLLGEGGRINAGLELMRWALRRSPFTLPSLVLALVEELPWLSEAKVREVIDHGKRLRAEVLEALGPRGVMLFPSYVRTAPKHGRPLLYPRGFVYTGIFNCLEMPVTQVPLGLSREGLPLGLQVASAPGNDHVTIAVALELERAFGGWVPPPC